MFKIGLMVTSLLCSLSISVWAQGDKDTWQRVYTGEDSAIDVSVLSLTFGAAHVMRARYRTTLSNPEPVREKPGTKYKSRLETIEFKLTDNRYRVWGLSWLDSAGKVVQSYEASASEEWKVLKAGGVMQKLFDAARQLPPFGEWKVVDYRFAEGPSADAQEFRRLLGTRVRLDSNRAEVGRQVCSFPAYESRRITEDEFLRDLGFSMASIGVKANYADTIVVKCEAKGWAPPRSLFIKVPDGGMLMLWEGVFLVLKK